MFILKKLDSQSPLQGSSDLAVVSQTDNPIPTVTDPCPASDPVENSSSISEPDHDTSGCQRRAPGRFTYPQLGKPLNSFAQTILEGFNKVLVEAFEGNPFPSENVMKGLMPV